MTVTLVLHSSQSAFDITGVEPATSGQDGTTRVVLDEIVVLPPPRCRNCAERATVAIRSGLEWHPTCEECASWWAPHRRGPLAHVEPGYRYD